METFEGNDKRWRWTNRQGMDPEGPCIWLSEELQKDVSRRGTSDLCSDDSITIGNYVLDAVLSVPFMISLSLHFMKDVLFIPICR